MPGRAGRPLRSSPRQRAELHSTRWGWHKLDSRWAAQLVAAARVQRGDLVLDVGAGTGAITSALVAAGAQVVAVELHPARAAALRARFDGSRVKVVQADAADLWLPRRPFKVVANPPFALTTAVLRRLTSPHSRLERGVLVLPAWAVARWANRRGSGSAAAYGRFSFSSGLWLPRQAFTPPPPVPTRVLEVQRLPAKRLPAKRRR